MNEINVAVVGLGFMGVTHLKAYQKIPNVRIAALCDAVRLPVDGVLAAAGGNIGSDDSLTFDMTRVKATHDLNELLTDPAIDLIDICVPTSMDREPRVFGMGPVTGWEGSADTGETSRATAARVVAGMAFCRTRSAADHRRNLMATIVSAEAERTNRAWI